MLDQVEIKCSPHADGKQRVYYRFGERTWDDEINTRSAYQRRKSVELAKSALNVDTPWTPEGDGGSEHVLLQLEQKLRTAADAAESDSPFRSTIEYKRITSADLATGDYAIEYLIENTMVAGQPLIIAGSQKTLKTSFIIDAAIALTTGGYFLGMLRVPRACRVMVMTGESGLATIQETAKRVCGAAGRELGHLANLLWSTDLPKFGDVAHLEALEKFLTENEIEVLFVDPAYLAMPGADAGNLMLQGELLRSVSDLCQRIGVTMVLAHHTKKGINRDASEPPELCDIAWSGFAEFARQWWLLGRRETYEPGTGEHRLWLSVGGSAGHGALWAVDVAEGVSADPGGRRWEVSVRKSLEARDDAVKRKREAKAREKERLIEVDYKTLIDAIAKLPGQEGTKTDIKDASGLRTPRFDPVLAAAIQKKDFVPASIKKGNGQTYPGYKLAGAEPVAPPSPGHSDAPGHQSDNQSRPGGDTHTRTNPYKGLSVCGGGADRNGVDRPDVLLSGSSLGGGWNP